jgi:hypothetical protein
MEITAVGDSTAVVRMLGCSVEGSGMRFVEIEVIWRSGSVEEGNPGFKVSDEEV